MKRNERQESRKERENKKRDRRDKRKAGIYAKQAWIIEAEKGKGVES